MANILEKDDYVPAAQDSVELFKQRMAKYAAQVRGEPEVGEAELPLIETPLTDPADRIRVEGSH